MLPRRHLQAAWCFCVSSVRYSPAVSHIYLLSLTWYLKISQLEDACCLWAAHRYFCPLRVSKLPHCRVCTGCCLQAASGKCHPSELPQGCSCSFFVLSLKASAGPSVIIWLKASQDNGLSVALENGTL